MSRRSEHGLRLVGVAARRPLLLLASDIGGIIEYGIEYVSAIEYGFEYVIGIEYLDPLRVHEADVQAAGDCGDPAVTWTGLCRRRSHGRKAAASAVEAAAAAAPAASAAMLHIVHICV